MREEIVIKQFNGKDVEIITSEDKILFEVYGTGMVLGYETKAKGKTYPHKIRIERAIKNAEIELIIRENNEYLDLIGLRKFITVAKTDKREEFIDWLKENNYIDYKEVFGTERKETVFLKTLRKILIPMKYTLKQQIVDGQYRLDAYIPELDLVIEYDENGHAHYDKNNEKEREMYIRENYSHLIRLTDTEDLYTNIGIVMNKIMNV